MIRAFKSDDYMLLADLLNTLDDQDPATRTFAPEGRTAEDLMLELGDDSPDHEILAYVLVDDSDTNKILAYVSLITEDDEHVLEGPVMLPNAPVAEVIKLVKHVLKQAPSRNYEFIDAFVDEENTIAQDVLYRAGMREFRTTYLYEITREAHANLPCLELPDIFHITQEEDVDVTIYRDLYRDTTEDWHDRLSWNDETLAAHFAQDDISLLFVYVKNPEKPHEEGVIAGHLELETIVIDKFGGDTDDADDDSKEAEISYFGILPEMRRQGIGRHLVRAGLALAFADDDVDVVMARAHDDERAACRALEALGFNLRQSVIGFTWEAR